MFPNSKTWRSGHLDTKSSFSDASYKSSPLSFDGSKWCDYVATSCKSLEKPKKLSFIIGGCCYSISCKSTRVCCSNACNTGTFFFHYNGILRNVLQTFLSTIGCSIEEKKAYITKMQFTINPSHQCLSFSIWPWCAYNCGLSRKHFFGTRIVLSYANKGGNHDDNCERLQHFANEVIKTE